MTKLKFSLVVANNLDQVAAAFRRNRDGDVNRQQPLAVGRARQAGTLQVSRWTFKRRPQGSCSSW